MSKAYKRTLSQISQPDEELTTEVVAEAVKAILTLDHLKRPMKYSDIIHLANIKIKRKQQLELWTLVRQALAELGMVLTDTEVGQSKAFLLTQNAVDDDFLRQFATEEERADRTLLILILAFIFMKDGLATEGEIFEHLSELEIYPEGSHHEYFGDVKKKIQGKFVEQLYLQRTVLPDQDIIELRWGQRAVLEVCPKLILNFVCAVGYYGKVEPKHWTSQFERAHNDSLDFN